MSLGLYESRLYERRRKRSRVFKWLLVLGGLGAAGMSAYETGSAVARVEVDQLQARVEKLLQSSDALEQRVVELELAARQAKAAEDQWRQRYESVRDAAPKGEAGRLLGLIAKQIDAGVAPDRLAFVIEATGRKPDCAEKPVTKRFVVRTPLSKGANDTVSFADNAIVVTSEGESATTAEGKPEAWFDPAKPITVRFTALDGVASQANGLLPLSHAVVVGEHEYRFTMTTGENRGFVNVTGDRCRFP